jgi:serine protease Do
VFSLDREVVAVAGGDGRLVFAVPYALERLGRLVADGTPMPLTLGLTFQPLTEALSATFGDAGVIVAAVEPGGPAARADIRPADVITAIGGTAVADMDSARLVIARLPAGAPAEIVLRRDGRDLAVQVAPEPTLAPPGSAPRLDADLGDRPAAADVFEARDLAAAGVSGQARVLAIAGRSVTARTATAQRRRTRAPWLVYLDHEGHRFFALVGARS